jgi:uroporphyrinogen-III synthase
MTDLAEARPLAGRRIALLETREAERLAQMFREQGAIVINCRTVAIVDVSDPAPVLAWLGRFVAEPPDYLMLMTGEGLTRLHRLAQGAGIDSGFLASLGRTTTIIRGPKPARALRSLGLAPQLRAENPTTDGVVALLSGLDLRHRRVGVQLYPGASGSLCDHLECAGARPDPVIPYEYAACEPDEALAGLIDLVAAGEIDAVAFTSASQARRLFDVARAGGEVDRLTVALRNCAVAAVGPVVALELQQHGVVPTIVPFNRYFMKPLVMAVAKALSEAT